MSGYKIIVLAKQVPDTRNVGKDAMKEDGTVNRANLPAVFNPDDLCALEKALRVKDAHKGSTVTLITMGPGRAADIIREGLFRGIDEGYLLTDRKFAGSDTLATSYTLAMAIKKLAPYHLVFSGRQAIDGDTAQVGPQTAEKLGIPQITYAEEIQSIKKDTITIKRRLENGIETVESPLPAFITVHGSAHACRPKNAKLVMKYKHACTTSEIQNADEDYLQLYNERPYLTIPEWGVDDIKAEDDKLGLSGSPTKVKKIESVVFKAKEAKVLHGEDTEIDDLMKELVANHTLG